MNSNSSNRNNKLHERNVATSNSNNNDNICDRNDEEFNYNNSNYGNNYSNNDNNNNNHTSYITPDESCSVAAVINNGASEVGVALCTFPALHIGIAQFGDSCTFSKTLTLLYTHNPV